MIGFIRIAVLGSALLATTTLAAESSADFSLQRSGSDLSSKRSYSAGARLGLVSVEGQSGISMGAQLSTPVSDSLDVVGGLDYWKISYILASVSVISTSASLRYSVDIDSPVKPFVRGGLAMNRVAFEALGGFVGASGTFISPDFGFGGAYALSKTSQLEAEYNFKSSKYGVLSIGYTQAM